MTVQEIINWLEEYPNKNHEIWLYDCEAQETLRMIDKYPEVDSNNITWCKIEFEHL